MTLRPALLALALVATGCAGTASPPPAEVSRSPAGGTGSTARAESGSPLGSPFSDEGVDSDSIGTPLLIDRLDMRLGTTVQLRRLPTPSELHDLTLLPGLARIVLS